LVVDSLVLLLEDNSLVVIEELVSLKEELVANELSLNEEVVTSLQPINKIDNKKIKLSFFIITSKKIII